MIKTVFLSSDYPHEKAIDDQINSWFAENPDVEHFVDVNKSITSGYNTTRDIIELSRILACICIDYLQRGGKVKIENNVP